MNSKLIIFAASILLLSTNSFAQKKMSREDFRQAEWRMKSDYYQKLQARQGSNFALDQTDYDVKYWELDMDVTNIGGQIVSGKVTMTSECLVDGTDYGRL